MMTPASPVALTGSDQAVYSGPATYHGFTLRETAGAVATVRIYDGLTGTGIMLDTVRLSANESAREFYEKGLAARLGIFVDIVTGAVEGSVRIG